MHFSPRWFAPLAVLAALSLGTTAHAQYAGGYSVSGPGSLIFDPGNGVWPSTFPSAFAESSVSVPANALTIEEVRILGLFHPRMGDLHAVLVSPSGGQYTLFHRPGFDGSSGAFSADFVGDYGVSSEPNQAWPSSDPGDFAVLSPGAYPQSFGSWPNGAGGIGNVELRKIAVTPGTWKLRLYDWSAPFIGSFSGWELRGARRHGFNIEFDAYNTPPSNTYAGAAQAGTWNVLGYTPQISAILPTDGVGPSAQLEHTPSYGMNYYLPGVPSEDAYLLDDVMRSGGPLDLAVTGIRNGRWGVWVYAWDPSNAEIPTVAVHGGTRGAQPLTGPWAGALQLGVTHSYDEVIVTAHRLEVTVDSALGNPMINGFQLVYLGAAVYDWQPYCAPGLSQNGCYPTLIAFGSLKASATSGFTVQAYDVDGQRNALFLYGLEPAQLPFGAGNLCIFPPLQRAGGLQQSGGATGTCGGSLSLDLRAWLAAHPYSFAQPLAPGQALYCQYWYRDSTGGAELNTTDAIVAYVVP